MTVREIIGTVWQQPLLAAFFLLLTGQMALILAAFRDGRSLRAKLPLLVHLALSALVLWLCLAEIAWHLFMLDSGLACPGLLAAFAGLPVGVFILYEAATAAALGFALRETLRYRASHVTPGSVKQTMDLLPVGAAFGRPDGTVLLRNLAMDHLSRELTGKALTDLTAFRAAAGASGRQTQTALPDGSVWQIVTRETDAGKERLVQLTAEDITGQARILRDLEEKNKKLRDIHMRLEIYNRQADRIIIAQELLTARMTVHNELGSVLLESRHYMNDPESIDERLLLQALKNTNTYLLSEYEKDDTAVDPLADAVETAGAIGVNVTLTGVPPAEEGPRLVLGAAIRECAANAVKHAEGDRLQADVRRMEAGYTFVLSGNGRPPEGPVRESGGLLSLRALVERQGGTLQIDCLPGVRVTISVPFSASS